MEIRMARDLELAVSMVLSNDTEISCGVDTLNDDATFTIVGALARVHELSGQALDTLRAKH
jgi:hypothetical protein